MTPESYAAILSEIAATPDTSPGNIAECGELRRPLMYQPKFRYWTIRYTYPDCAVCDGRLERSEQYPDAGLLHRDDANDATHAPVARQQLQGAYADETLCDINVALNERLLAEKVEVWY